MRKRHYPLILILVGVVEACSGGKGGQVPIPVVDGPSTIKITSPQMNEGTIYSEMDIKFDIALGKADGGSYPVIFLNGRKVGEARNKKGEPQRYYPLKNLENGTYNVRVAMANNEGKIIEGVEDVVTFSVSK